MSNRIDKSGLWLQWEARLIKSVRILSVGSLLKRRDRADRLGRQMTHDALVIEMLDCDIGSQEFRGPCGAQDWWTRIGVTSSRVQKGS